MRYKPAIRYLARVFIDNTPPPATREMFERARAAIAREDLTATVAQEVNNNASRIAFVGAEGWQITLVTGSFDITLAPTSADGANMGALGAFAGEAARILPALLRTFDRTGHRIALAQEGHLDLPVEDLQGVAERVLNPPRIFWDSPPFEWDWRAANRIVRHFGGGEELTHTVVTLRRQLGVFALPGALPEEFDRVRLDVDVNTSPRAESPRYTPERVSAFFAAAPVWHDEIWAQMEAFISLGGGRV